MEGHDMGEGHGGCGHDFGHHGEHADKFGMMMCLAKEAHMELLKEKLKRRIDSTQGKKMDEIVSVIADAMAEKMKARMEAKRRKHEMWEKLEEILMEE